MNGAGFALNYSTRLLFVERVGGAKEASLGKTLLCSSNKVFRHGACAGERLREDSPWVNATVLPKPSSDWFGYYDGGRFCI